MLLALRRDREEEDLALIGGLPVKTVGNGGSTGFVDDAEDVQGEKKNR